MNEKITTLAFSFNEEHRIREFLEAVKYFSPIVVIDNYSTDNTLRIAGGYTNRIYQRHNVGYVEHPDSAKYALSLANTEWVYWGRVDEIPPVPLLGKLAEIVQKDLADAVLISRLNLVYGSVATSWGKDYQLILFKKDFIDLSRSALFEHGAIRDSARITRLPATKELSLWHFSDYDISGYITSLNRYSSVAAEIIIENPGDLIRGYSHSTELMKRIAKNLAGRVQAKSELTGIRLVTAPFAGFLWHYVIRGGWRSGRVGFVTSYLMAMYQMLIELKIWEVVNPVSRVAIGERYARFKAELLAGDIPEISKGSSGNRVGR